MIVGAGPAGAAAALAARAARADARVLLLDRATFPRDKACGDAIGPQAIAQLEALGVVDVLDGYPALTQFELGAGETVIRHDLRGPTYTVPRRVFDARLVAAAVATGARFARRRVRAVVGGDDRVVIDDEIAARVVVGADGANSRVRRLSGHPTNPETALAVAMRGYADAGAVTGQRIVLDERRWPAYGWTFAIGDGRANVGWGALRAGFDGTARDLERHVEAQAGGAVDDLSAHHLPLTTWRPPPAASRVLLAGDAASLINPLSGEGIFYALLSGALAGRLAVTAEPATVDRRYTAALRHRLGRHLRHTRIAARMLDVPALRSAGLRAAGRSPRAFGDLTELALGDGRLTAHLLTTTARALLA